MSTTHNNRLSSTFLVVQAAYKMVTARPAARPLAIVGHAILLGVLLCSPVLWTFRETFKGEWEWHVGHDDGINFLQNKKILSLSRENIAWMWNDGVLLGESDGARLSCRVPFSRPLLKHSVALPFVYQAYMSRSAG